MMLNDLQSTEKIEVKVWLIVSIRHGMGGLKMHDWKMKEQIWGQARRWKMRDRKMEDRKMEDQKTEDRKLQDQVLARKMQE